MNDYICSDFGNEFKSNSAETKPEVAPSLARMILGTLALILGGISVLLGILMFVTYTSDDSGQLADHAQEVRGLVKLFGLGGFLLASCGARQVRIYVRGGEGELFCCTSCDATETVHMDSPRGLELRQRLGRIPPSDEGINSPDEQADQVSWLSAAKYVGRLLLVSVGILAVIVALVAVAISLS